MTRALFVLSLLLASCADTTIPKEHPRTTDPVLGIAPREKLGTVMTADGMTVYVFTEDRPLTVCYDICAMNWPPLLVTHTPALAASFPGRFASVTRKDGTKQCTYNGQPLYLYIEDPPGTDQANGQNVDQQWFVVHP